MTRAPFNDADRLAVITQALKSSYAVDELLQLACQHLQQAQTQFQDQDKHWTVEDTLDLLALAIVKLQTTTHACTRWRDSGPPPHWLQDRLDHFRGLLG